MAAVGPGGCQGNLDHYLLSRKVKQKTRGMWPIMLLLGSFGNVCIVNTLYSSNYSQVVHDAQHYMGQIVTTLLNMRVLTRANSAHMDSTCGKRGN